MKELYKSAIDLKKRRISQCGKALQNVSDEYSVLYWDKELKLAQFELYNIKKRQEKSK